MAEASIVPIRPIIPGMSGVQPDGRFGHHREPPKRRLKIPARLIQALIPGGDEEGLEMLYDVQGGEFLGVIIRNRETGTIVRYLDAEELQPHEDRPGMLLERRG